MTINALTGLPGALAFKWDLVGPTVDDDLRRLVTRYGKAAVKEATKRVTKAKRGPKTIPDWLELADVIEADARAWLAGDDPMKHRSNYAIAKDFAERSPGAERDFDASKDRAQASSQAVWPALSCFGEGRELKP